MPGPEIHQHFQKKILGDPHWASWFPDYMGSIIKGPGWPEVHDIGLVKLFYDKAKELDDPEMMMFSRAYALHLMVDQADMPREGFSLVPIEKNVSGYLAGELTLLKILQKIAAIRTANHADVKQDLSGIITDWALEVGYMKKHAGESILLLDAYSDFPDCLKKDNFSQVLDAGLNIGVETFDTLYDTMKAEVNLISLYQSDMDYRIVADNMFRYFLDNAGRINPKRPTKVKRLHVSHHDWTKWYLQRPAVKEALHNALDLAIHDIDEQYDSVDGVIARIQETIPPNRQEFDIIFDKIVEDDVPTLERYQRIGGK
ncbi:MAG: hypothetical protein ABIC95_03755 [archaeon]